MTRCILPYGNHGPGRLRALKTATHGVPTAAARCIGPLSCPTNILAFSRSAALSRGVVRPHKFRTLPRKAEATRSLPALSPADPSISRPSSELLLSTLAINSRHLSTPQSFTSNLVPIQQATKLPVHGQSLRSSVAFARSALFSRKSQLLGSPINPLPSTLRDLASRSLSDS